MRPGVRKGFRIYGRVLCAVLFARMLLVWVLAAQEIPKSQAELNLAVDTLRNRGLAQDEFTRVLQNNLNAIPPDTTGGESASRPRTSTYVTPMALGRETPDAEIWFRLGPPTGNYNTARELGIQRTFGRGSSGRATITDGDIDYFLQSPAPEDVKRQVRESPDDETKKRFVAGYLIRTNQISPERLNPEGKKATTRKASSKKQPDQR